MTSVRLPANGSGQKLGILSRQSKGAEKSAPFFVDIAQINSESTINRHRDFSFFLDSGAAFIVTPLL